MINVSYPDSESVGFHLENSAPMPVLSSYGLQNPSLRGAVFIGTGAVTAYHHLPGLRLDPRAELVAICDTDPEVLGKLQTAVARLVEFKQETVAA